MLCHPWGAEYIHAYRAMRQLAKMLAANGIHTLRFDYFGTGDSAGSTTAGDLGGWQTDIQSAIEELKDTTGAARVSLVGLRLGATLAANVAARAGSAVNSLVLWDPVVSGAEYLAELFHASRRGWLRLKSPATLPAEEGGGHEIMGFPLTELMAKDVRLLDLAALAPALPQRTLVVVSQRVASHGRLQRALDHRPTPLAIEDFDSPPGWVEWPMHHPLAGTVPGQDSSTDRRVGAMRDGILDQAVMIGVRKTLVGIMTQPVDYEPNDRPVFLILNSGIIHRVGHHRMYVTLARALAGVGYPVLRFDLSGIGDSESREDGLSMLDAALADVREAVDWLFTVRRARKVILVGLCSGADQALVYGISDRRVCGLVLLDPSIPPTRQYRLRFFLRHAIAPKSWFNILTGAAPCGSSCASAWAFAYRRRLGAPHA